MIREEDHIYLRVRRGPYEVSSSAVLGSIFCLQQSMPRLLLLYDVRSVTGGREVEVTHTRAPSTWDVQHLYARVGFAYVSQRRVL